MHARMQLHERLRCEVDAQASTFDECRGRNINAQLCVFIFPVLTGHFTITHTLIATQLSFRI